MDTFSLIIIGLVVVVFIIGIYDQEPDNIENNTEEEILKKKNENFKRKCSNFFVFIYINNLFKR